MAAIDLIRTNVRPARCPYTEAECGDERPPTQERVRWTRFRRQQGRRTFAGITAEAEATLTAIRITHTSVADWNVEADVRNTTRRGPHGNQGTSKGASARTRQGAPAPYRPHAPSAIARKDLVWFAS